MKAALVLFLFVFDRYRNNIFVLQRVILSFHLVLESDVVWVMFKIIDIHR